MPSVYSVFMLWWLEQWWHADVQHRDLHTMGQQNEVLLLASTALSGACISTNCSTGPTS